VENQKNYKGIITMLIIIIVILSAFCILLATGTISFKNCDCENNNDQLIENDDNITNNEDLNNENNSEDLNDEIITNPEENSNYKSINLSKATETFDFDKLHLEFNGTNTKNGEEYFNYALNIKYDGKNINNAFFNDKDKYRIWSSNMAANFKVYKVDNVYILVSSIAKQCFGDEIMIFNTNGEVLKTFTISEFSIDGSSISISTSDNGHCMGEDWEKHVTKYNFKINGSKLLEQ
jgi:hypothetical protein